MAGGLGMTLLSGEKLEAPMSLWKVAKSPLPLPKDQHSFIHSTDVSWGCGV